MGYDKTQLANEAANWVNYIKTNYAQDIANSIKNGITVEDAKVKDFINVQKRFPHTDVSIVKTGVESSFEQYVDKGLKVCVLNFASYKHPGGGFIRGQFAQEEAICHASTLYPVLEAYQSSYDRHTELHNGLYAENFLYHPAICFLKAQHGVPLVGNYYVDIMTYAAPNMFRKSKDNPAYLPTLQKRMEIAYLFPARFSVDVLVLGAWGCGVFMNDGELIAHYWDLLTKKYDGLYKVIVHPIPDGKNLLKFQKVIHTL